MRAYQATDYRRGVKKKTYGFWFSYRCFQSSSLWSCSELQPLDYLSFTSGLESLGTTNGLSSYYHSVRSDKYSFNSYTTIPEAEDHSKNDLLNRTSYKTESYTIRDEKLEMEERFWSASSPGRNRISQGSSRATNTIFGDII